MKRFNLMKKFTSYLKDESGQTSTEYILLLAIVAAVIFKFNQSFSTNMEGIVETMFGKVKGILNNLN
jgi:pilus assembly protein Flp/PilA